MKLKQQIENTIEYSSADTYSAGLRGNHLKAEVLAEWRASAVNDDITKLNVIYLSGTDPYEYLLFALPRCERRNDGRLRDKWLNRYEHCDRGGWWCSGIDVLTGEPAVWGQFKPKFPYRYIKKRQNNDFKGSGTKREPKTIKYEPPRKVPTEIYALRVSLNIWETIAKLNNVPLPFSESGVRSQESVLKSQSSRVTNTELVQPNNTVDISNKDISTSSINENKSETEKLLPRSRLLTPREAKGFWAWVLANPSIPVIITEGAKKAGALLSAGYVAIALPGIWNGIRKPKDEFGRKTGLAFLIPQLKVFAAQGREINFCFDNDVKPKTQRQVKKAIAETGKLFEKEGCIVKVITWDSPEKGVDDLIVAKGRDAFDEAYKARKPLSSFKLFEILDLSRFVSLTINQRYLTEQLIPPEDAKIIGVKSAKNTGKTVWLTAQVQQALNEGRKAIVITHRIQLAKALSIRFGIEHIEEIPTSASGGQSGYALCIDSLHADSMAQFNPEDWEGASIIIDEAEQVFWHALNSSTLKLQRVKILTNLELTIKIALTTGGKIYLADADLSPICLQYVQKLALGPVKTWVVQNQYLPNKSKRKLFTYTGGDPKLLLSAALIAIADGKKILIHTSGQKQKSKWGTTNLEKFIKQKLGDRGKSIGILRIDAKSVKDPSHPAYCCTKNLDGMIRDYDVVLASPTVETGISIDTKGHFDSVWCIAWGVQTVDAVCQSVERLRDDVPRHLWARSSGIKFVGNRATNVKKLLASTHTETRCHIAYLSKAGYQDFDSLDWDWQTPHLITWARRAAIVNAGMYKYHESIVAKLAAEGYQILNPDDPTADEMESAQELKADLKEQVRIAYHKYCQDVAGEQKLSFEEYQRLESKLNTTEAEDRQLKKAQISKRYGDIEVTPELVEKDDNGWHAKIQLHYYLTIGNQFLAARDAAKLKELTKDTNKAFKPDVNKQQLAIRVNGLEIIGIKQFFKPGAVFSDRTLKNWLKLVSAPVLKQNIKDIYGVNICQAGGAIAQANKLLNKMDLKLVQCGWAGGKKDGHRLYKLVPIDHDGRAAVFGKWLERDFNYNVDPNTALYLGQLWANPSNGFLNNKMLLEIAAAGGKYQAPPRQSTVEEHSIEDCAWLLCQIQKFLQSHRDPSGWLEFFESVEANFFAATWDYIAKFKGIDFVRDLASKIFAVGGEKAVIATQVAF